LSIPTLLDSSLAPPGHHILHIFTTAWIDDWEVRVLSVLSSCGTSFWQH
jgi:phytoene dehydrogenase-like protein